MTIKPFRLGAGIRPDSDRSEKPTQNKLYFYDTSKGDVIGWEQDSKEILLVGDPEGTPVELARFPGSLVALSRWQSSDFYSTGEARNQPFFGNPISSGSTTVNPAAADFHAQHPGMVLLRSSATANAGYRWQTEVTLRGGVGLSFRGLIKLFSDTGRDTRIGFGDSVSAAAHANGAWVRINTSIFSPAFTINCANNGTTTTTSTGLTPSAIWYTIDITYVSNSTVRFTVRNDSGTVLYDGTISTNVPNADNRRFVAGIIATEASATSSDIVLVDYMGLGPQPIPR